MVQKQAALRDGTGDDFFAEDDPLAELARIVGFETPYAPKPAEPERHEPEFDLEDELLREFETYDAPTPAPQSVLEDERYEPQPMEPEAVEPDRGYQALWDETGQPQPATDVADAYYPESIDLPQSYEAQAFAPDTDYGVENITASAESALGQNDLADELERAIADFPQFAEQAEMQVSPEPAEVAPVYSQPLYNAPQLDEPAFFEAVNELPVEAEPVQPSRPSDDRAMDLDPEPDLVGEEMYDVPARPEPRLNLPIANFAPSRANLRREPDFEPLPAPVPEPEFVAAVEPEPVLSDEDLFADDDLFAGEASASEDPFDWTAPVAGTEAAEPYEAPAFEPAIRSTDVHAFADTPAGLQDAQPQRREPEIDFRLSAPTALPAAEPRPPLAADDEFDPFADSEFELALDDIELDLSDLEPEPAAAPAPTPVQQAEPANAPMPSMAKAALQPVAAAPVAPPRPVAQPASHAPQPTAADNASMPFDLSQIAEQDEPLTTMAALDVPEIPNAEAHSIPDYKPDYGIDIDSELASMFAGEASSAPETPAVPAEPAAAKPAAMQADFREFERAFRQDFDQSVQNGGHAEAQRPRKIPLQKAVESVPEEGSNRRWLLAASVAFIAIIGAGGLYAWMGGSTAGLIESGEPVVILADKDPIKVVPENRGGAAVPNQDKAVYDRVEGAVVQPKQESLISSSEEPVDVVQRTLLPQNAPDDGAEADADSGQSTPVGETEDPRLLPNSGQEADTAADDAVTITPRKVRTMIVRPDGTLVEKEVPQDLTPQPAPVEAATTLAASNVESAAESLATPTAAEPETAPSQTSVETGQPDLASASPATGETVEPAGTEAETAAQEPAAPAPDNTPVPSARPATQPSTVAAAASDGGNNVAQTPAATAQPAAPAAAPAPVETASAVPPGTYVVQVASLPSEAEAQKSYQNLSARYSSIIGGRGVDIKRADIAGKGTYYRVRIPAGTRDQAIAMCENLKAAGGSCLVAR